MSHLIWNSIIRSLRVLMKHFHRIGHPSQKASKNHNLRILRWMTLLVASKMGKRYYMRDPLSGCLVGESQRSQLPGRTSPQARGSLQSQPRRSQTGGKARWDWNNSQYLVSYIWWLHGGFQMFPRFFIFCWGNDPFWRIFFKWVGSTTN